MNKERAIYFYKIVLPILVTQVALMSMSFFDTTMSGQAGADQLAGVAVGVSLWVPASTGLTGILLAVTPIVAQYIGARKEEKVSNIVQQGIYLSTVIAVAIIVAGLVGVPFILNLMSLETEVRRVAVGYLTALAFGIIPYFIYTVIRCFIDALGKTKVTMMITLLAMPLNILLNYLFIFGHLGFPELGGIGAGVASAITNWFILIVAIIIIVTNKPFSHFAILKNMSKPVVSVWKKILVLGIPIGFSIFFETSIFSVVTLFLSAYSTETIAAHQAAMNFASLLYMSPLSISMAMTIVVGKEVGAKNSREAKQYTILGISTALCISVLCGLIIYFFHSEVAGMYTKDSTVLALTEHFLMYAIFFQVSDAIAAPVQGALRGYKDVNVTLVMTLIAYWVIGLPSGYLLANFTDLEAYGYWIGLICGLAFAAVALIIRLIQLQKTKELENIVENMIAE